MAWRNKVDPSIKSHLELQIRETMRYKNAYSLSKNKAVAQLWCAIANLSKQILDLNLKIKLVEAALKDSLSHKPLKEIHKKKKASKLEKSLKRL